MRILYLLERMRTDDNGYYWPGYTLADPEALADLTAEDRAAWDAWVVTPQVEEFLDQVIATCKAQAEANKKCSGYVVFHAPPTQEPQ